MSEKITVVMKTLNLKSERKEERKRGCDSLRRGGLKVVTLSGQFSSTMYKGKSIILIMKCSLFESQHNIGFFYSYV